VITSKRREYVLPPDDPVEVKEDEKYVENNDHGHPHE
jgi:hypothetical protein